MPSIAAQLIANGLIAGALYALVASGFSLIYQVTKFLNFAHGAMLSIAAYAMFFFSTQLQVNFWLSALLAIIITLFAGLLTNQIVYKPLRKRKASSAVLLIASVSLLMLITALLKLIFGHDNKIITLGAKMSSYDVLGAYLTTAQIVIIAITPVLLLFLWWLMKKTRLGKAIRALSDNKDIAQTVGINPGRMYIYTFLISTFIAAIAGILAGIDYNVNPPMGISLIIRGFTGSIIGGANSVPGAVLGSLLLGLVENIGIWWLPSGYKDAIAFALLFIFLIFRPQGILGVKTER